MGAEVVAVATAGNSARALHNLSISGKMRRDKALEN